MAATTTNYAFPYPEDADVVDVAGDIQSLAQDIDSKLSEAIADTVGAMVTSNTENGISVTYDDTDNTLDFDVADFTLTFLGDVSGSASITNLASASATITIAANSVALGTDTTGNYVATAAAGTGIDVSGSGSETAALTITNTGVIDLTGTADEVTVSASAGSVTLSLPATINANTTGTAASLTTPRTIELTGDVTGTISFDGSASASMSTYIAANSVALGTDTTGNYVATAAAGTGIDVSGSGSETAALTITNTGVTSLTGTADEVTVSASAGAVTLSLPATINANTTGTAASLTTARTIELTGDVTGTISFDGSASASMATTIAADSVALGTDTTGNYIATITGTANEVEVSGSGSESATVTIGLPNDVVIGNNLTVTGDLTVSGSTVYLNVIDLLVEDNIIVLNSGVSASPSLNAGIEIERGTSANTSIRWNESTDVWQFTNDGTNFYSIQDFDTALGTKTTDNLTQGSTNLYYTDEKAQDAVAAAIAAGTHTNITITYNDATNSLDFVGSASISNETIQDAVAPLLVHANHTNVTATYDDANNEIILVGSAASGGGGTSTNVALSSSWWLGV